LGRKQSVALDHRKPKADDVDRSRSRHPSAKLGRCQANPNIRRQSPASDHRSPRSQDWSAGPPRAQPVPTFVASPISRSIWIARNATMSCSRRPVLEARARSQLVAVLQASNAITTSNPPSNIKSMPTRSASARMANSGHTARVLQVSEASFRLLDAVSSHYFERLPGVTMRIQWSNLDCFKKRTRIIR
jgi:hypothetical protein